MLTSVSNASVVMFMFGTDSCVLDLVTDNSVSAKKNPISGDIFLRIAGIFFVLSASLDNKIPARLIVHVFSVIQSSFPQE